MPTKPAVVLSGTEIVDHWKFVRKRPDGKYVVFKELSVGGGVHNVYYWLKELHSTVVVNDDQFQNLNTNAPRWERWIESATGQIVAAALITDVHPSWISAPPDLKRGEDSPVLIVVDNGRFPSPLTLPSGYDKIWYVLSKESPLSCVSLVSTIQSNFDTWLTWTGEWLPDIWGLTPQKFDDIAVNNVEIPLFFKRLLAHVQNQNLNLILTNGAAGAVSISKKHGRVCVRPPRLAAAPNDIGAGDFLAAALAGTELWWSPSPGVNFQDMLERAVSAAAEYCSAPLARFPKCVNST